MKIRSLLIPILLLVAAISCNKSQYQVRPQISIESINSVIPAGGGLDALLKFTQKNAQLGGGTFIAIRNRLNQTPLPPGTGSTDTLVSNIPTFPDKNQGEFEFKLDYSYLHESDSQNDTFRFKFAVIDRSGNKSDTISSNKVVVLYQ